MTTNTRTYKTEFRKNGRKYYEKYLVNGEFHNENGPAFIEYYENGNIYCEHYYINNKLHNENGPAIIKYYNNGNIHIKKYYLNDKLYNENGPVIIDYYRNGSKYYEEFNSKTESITISYYSNGNKKFEEYLDRVNSRKQLISYYENGNIFAKYYYFNRQLHNENEPAIIKYNENGTKHHEEYFLNGIFVMSGEEVEKYINSTKPIKIRKINKLQLLYNICMKKDLKDKLDEIGNKLLSKIL